MEAVLVRSCHGCPFMHDSEYGTHSSCSHPKAPAGLEPATGPMPAECPLRRWSVLVQAADGPLTGDLRTSRFEVGPIVSGPIPGGDGKSGGTLQVTHVDRERGVITVQTVEPERVEAAGPYSDKRPAGREGE